MSGGAAGGAEGGAVASCGSNQQVNSQLKKNQRLTHGVGAKMFKRHSLDDGKQMDPILKKF